MHEPVDDPWGMLKALLEPLRHRSVVLWFASFLIVAIFLRCYGGVPISALLGAGGITLALTLARVRWSRRRERPAPRMLDGAE